MKVIESNHFDLQSTMIQGIYTIQDSLSTICLLIWKFSWTLQSHNKRKKKKGNQGSWHSKGRVLWQTFQNFFPIQQWPKQTPKTSLESLTIFHITKPMPSWLPPLPCPFQLFSSVLFLHFSPKLILSWMHSLSLLVLSVISFQRYRPIIVLLLYHI